MNTKQLQSILYGKKISRRDFVQLAIASGVSAAAAESMFVATARAQPKKGGRFRVGLGSGGTTDTLDPALSSDTFNGLFNWGTIRSSLTEVKADGQIVGDLAESFETSPDAKTWIFRLRKGVEFHNGKSLDAADVVTSFNHHLSESSKSAAKSILKAVSDIKATSKDTVVFTLQSGNADFPYITADYHLPIMPSVDGKADYRSGIGTGPYIKTEFVPGVRGTGKRFANYHGETWFDEVEVLSIVDVTARQAALLAGELDYIDRVDPKTVDLLSNNSSVEMTEVAGFAHYLAPMRCTAAPFDRKDVRLALKYAVDRKEIVDKILFGHGSIGNDNPIAPGVPFWRDVPVKHVFDPDRARFHLRKAAMENLKVELSTSDVAFPGAIDTALLMRESASKAGIDIKVVKEPNDTYLDSVWLKKPWCMGYWNGRPTADLMFTTTYAAGAAWNETDWNNSRFNELLEAARSELDITRRASAYAEMQELVADDGGALILMFYNFLGANERSVAHGKLAPNWDVDGMKITSRWWFV